MSDPRGFAWVLNLDADVELASTQVGGAPYQPTSAVRAAMAPHVTRLAASLLGPDDVLIDETSPAGSARGLQGRAFCPTPRAVALLLRAGATPEPHPSRAILRTVNGRAFCASLGQTLPGAVFVDDLDAALGALEAPPPARFADRWRVKRAFGMSGRGQRVFAAGAALTEADRAFLRGGIAEGGVQIEPDVSIRLELALHGLLASNGRVRRGRLVAQECDARGQWLATRAVDGVDEATERAIASELDVVARSLHAAGYFGPFGIDAFLYGEREAPQARVLQPRSEINARYSMGFALGFGATL